MERSGWTFRTTNASGRQRIWRVAEPELERAEALVKTVVTDAVRVECLGEMSFDAMQAAGLVPGEIKEWT